jgi:hypothetical protein
MMNLDINHTSAFSKIFSPQVLNSIAEKGHSLYLKEVILKSGLIDQIDISMQFGDFLDLMYVYLLNNYKIEYIYKNTLVNRILLGRHSLNTAHMITEFRVGSRKADVVLLNGSSTVYEIKAEYDSYSRLIDQVNEYMQMFDFINVFTSKEQLTTVEKLVPDNVGLLYLSKSSISVYREAYSNKANIDLSVVFDSLRKKEYLNAVGTYYGDIPIVPNTRLFSVCKEKFCQIPVEFANELFVQELKKRKNARLLREFLKTAPASLSAYAIASIGSEQRLNTLLSQLDKPVESIIH